MTIIEILDRPVVFHRSLIKVTGSVASALLLSQAIYWQNVKKRTDPSGDGWWFKTQVDWNEEIGMSRAELETARAACVKSGVLQHERKSVPAKSYYRVNEEALSIALSNPDCGKPAIKSAGSQTSLPESSNPDCGKPAIKSAGNQQSSKGDEMTPEMTDDIPRVNIFESFKARVGGWFGRRPSTDWLPKEKKAVKEVFILDTPEEDIAVLEKYYQSGCDILRRDIVTLLHNWGGEIDRAKNFAKKPSLFRGNFQGKSQPHAPSHPIESGQLAADFPRPKML
jgi:hypothetical protein